MNTFELLHVSSYLLLLAQVQHQEPGLANRGLKILSYHISASGLKPSVAVPPDLGTIISGDKMPSVRSTYYVRGLGSVLLATCISHTLVWGWVERSVHAQGHPLAPPRSQAPTSAWGWGSCIRTASCLPPPCSF